MDAMDQSQDPSVSPCSSGIQNVSEMSEETDAETLQLQHEQLKREFWELKQNNENNLIPRVKELEARGLQTTAQINFVNGRWNQLDEDTEILIQRYGPNSELEEKFETETKISLQSLDERELENHLAQRAQQSMDSVTKIASIFNDMNVKENATLNGHGTAEKIGELNITLENKNSQIRTLAFSLNEKWDSANLKMKNMEENVRQANSNFEQLKDRLHNVNMKLPRLTYQFDKLANYAQDCKQKYVFEQENLHDVGNSPLDFDFDSGSSQEQESEMKDFQVLAQRRLEKLQILQVEHRQSLQELEKLKVEIRSLPEKTIEDTPTFQILAAKFDAAVEENAKLRQRMIQVKDQIDSLPTNRLKKINQMESEELLNQTKARDDIVHLDDVLGQIGRAEQSYQLKVEILRAKEAESGPNELLQEMRNLMVSMENHNKQLKGDLQRFQKKCDHISALAMKMQTPVEENENQNAEEQIQSPKPGAGAGSEVDVHKEKESEVIQNLRKQVKVEIDKLREMRYLLDICKAASNDTRDNEQLRESDRKLREELKLLGEKLETDKAELSKFTELGTEEEKRVNLMQAKVAQLRRQITSQKQEEEILCHEMEVTGQAVDDIREQNSRLQKKLKEKDEISMKLISDRMRTHEIWKTAQDKLNVLEPEVAQLKKRDEEQRLRISKMEIDEMSTMIDNILAKKKLSLGRHQESESLNVKALQMELDESSLKSLVDASHNLVEDLQKTAEAKGTALENAREQNNHLAKEIESYKRKIQDFNEAHGIVDNAKGDDEAMMEEIRLNKERLTCSCCKVNEVDALLTICFHAFCYHCLRTRYETRQRKCPKCNASFGANDYNRLHFN